MCCFVCKMWSQGVSLTQAKEKGQLVFLEGLKESLPILIPQEATAESKAMDFLRYYCCSHYIALVVYMYHFMTNSTPSPFCPQGSDHWPAESVWVCVLQRERSWWWRGSDGGVGPPCFAGGWCQRAVESGSQCWSRAGLHPLLQSHSLLSAAG